MKIGVRARLQWLRFGEFSTTLLYEVLRFRQAIFVVEQQSPYPDLDGQDEPAQHLLLRVEGEIAGYLRVIADLGAKRVAIGRVAVAATRRRHGFARLLIAEALARCVSDYPDCDLTLSAQTYLTPFYESFGFWTISPPFDDYGVPHVEMEAKRLGGDRLSQNHK